MLFASKTDKEKASAVYCKYRRLMYKVANDILGDTYLAEDAVSDAFERIIKNLHKINEINCPQTRNFVVIISRNTAINLYNKRAEELGTKLYGDEYGFEADCPSVEDIITKNETVDEIKRAIQRLKPIYRDAFLLLRLYKLSVKAAAELLGEKPETVKKRAARAKKMILQMLEEKDNEKQ